MSDISYKLVEQGIKILDLEASLTAEKNNSENLRHKAKESDDLKKQLLIVERENERLHIDLLNAKQAAQLAESGLEKALREISIWKDKFTEADKVRKQLKSLNPEKLKRNLAEQKRKTEVAKAAAQEWKIRAKKTRDEHQAEANSLKKLMLKVLQEQDFFAEVDNYRLTLSGFQFPSDIKNEKPRTRIRVTNANTSESCVVFDVKPDGNIELLSEMVLPEIVKDRVKTEWIVINENEKGAFATVR